MSLGWAEKGAKLGKGFKSIVDILDGRKGPDDESENSRTKLEDERLDVFDKYGVLLTKKKLYLEGFDLNISDRVLDRAIVNALCEEWVYRLGGEQDKGLLVSGCLHLLSVKDMGKMLQRPLADMCFNHTEMFDSVCADLCDGAEVGGGLWSPSKR